MTAGLTSLWACARVCQVEMVPVDPTDKSSIAELMKHASELRSTTATKMNAESSRSHSIFTLHLSATHMKQGVVLHGQLNLVDLAGSERIEKSGVTGQALTEAKHINTSLSALSNVFLSLGKKASHIPYRDSKLTELLAPALSANGKTLMMLNLSPLEASMSESISSLRFGTAVNSCELGKAKRVIKRSTDKSPTRDLRLSTSPGTDAAGGGGGRARAGSVPTAMQATSGARSPPRDLARRPSIAGRAKSPMRSGASPTTPNKTPPKTRPGFK